jgi:hypothetical protein
LFWEQINSNSLNILESDPLDGTTSPSIPYVFVADEPFGLSKHVMRPYGDKNLNVTKRIFNCHLSRARRYIECAFGILSNKWRIFHCPLDVSIEFSEEIVKTCIVIHNCVLMRDGYSFDDTLSYG